MEMDEMRLRRLSAQHLLAPVPPLQAAADLCGFQAQFLRNAVQGLQLRSGRADVSGMVKTWTLRGTVHLLPESDLPLYLPRHGTAEDVCDTPWYQWRAKQGNAPDPDRERTLAREALRCIAAGCDEREALRVHLRICGMSAAEEAHAFDPWGGLIREMAEAGLIAFRVEMADGVHPVETKRYRPLAPFAPMDAQAARRELLRRYITHYGPVTLRDASYFLRWTQREVRAVLAELPVTHLLCGGQVHFCLPCPEPVCGLPEVLLLPGFDPVMLGYRKEDNPFLPPAQLRRVFTLSGIVQPVILLRGEAAGRWKEKDGLIEFAAPGLSPRDQRAIEQEAERRFTLRRVKWL